MNKDNKDREGVKATEVSLQDDLLNELTGGAQFVAKKANKRNVFGDCNTTISVDVAYYA